MAKDGVLDIFELYESNHFFYRLKGRKKFKDTVEWLRSTLGEELEERLDVLLYDIGVVLQGNTEDERYPAAFSRYMKHYSGLSQQGLWDFCRFVCTSYDVAAPKIIIKPPKHIPYEQSEEVKGILNDINT